LENASRQWARRLPDSLLSQAIVCAGRTRRVRPGVRNFPVERAERAPDGVARKAAARARDEAELYLLIADEIKDPAERKAFVRKAISVSGRG